jgi:hypothetical protein
MLLLMGLSSDLTFVPVRLLRDIDRGAEDKCLHWARVARDCFAEKDWEDIKFGVDNKVDYYALSFVKDAEVVHELKDFLKGRGADIHVIVKIESADSIPNLQSILDAADGVGVPAVWSKLLLQHVLSNQLIFQRFKFPVLQGDLLGVVNLMQLFV